MMDSLEKNRKDFKNRFYCSSSSCDRKATIDAARKSQKDDGLLRRRRSRLVVLWIMVLYGISSSSFQAQAQALSFDKALARATMSLVLLLFSSLFSSSSLFHLCNVKEHSTFSPTNYFG